MNRTFKVLLVEDDVILAQVAMEGLQLAGHVVTWVETAARALEALKAAHIFEAVLLDLCLGAERGDSVFAQLQLLNIPYPPVVVLSGEPHSILQLAAQRIKTPHILAKPASIQQIDEALRRAVKDSGAELMVIAP